MDSVLLSKINKVQGLLVDTRPTKSTSLELHTVAGGGSQELLNVTGAGKVVSINLVINGTTLYNAYCSKIQIFIDDNVTPTVDMPVYDFFFGRGTPANVGDGVQWRSDRIGMSKHYVDPGVVYRLGFYRYIDIPYKQSCKILLLNGDGAVDMQCWVQVYYKEGHNSADNLLGKYGVNYLGSDPGYTTGKVITPYETVELLNIPSGNKGMLESVWLTVYQNPGQPWLEGDINIYIDGETEPSIKSSGTEDFFMSAFAWAGAYHTLNHGCVIREANGFTNVYRFLLPEQIHFNDGVRVVWHCGEEGQGSTLDSNLELWSSVGYYLKD